MHRNLVFAAVLCGLTLVLAVQAQVPTGSVSGIARDASARVIKGATVRATSKSQGIVRTTSTNADGSFLLDNLAPGGYGLVIASPGFADVQYASVQVEAGKAVTLDTALPVASEHTTITVTVWIEEEAVDLQQSLLQGQITSRTIESIPLNGRNFFELAYLIPGTRPAPVFDPTKTNTLEISSAGGFGRGRNITIDGGDNNDEIVGGTLSNLPEDSAGEFQIATARFTAEVGRSGNSIINVVTRSGGNHVHGSAFLFERNRHLQGLPATFDRTQPTPRFDREQFGG